MGSCCSSPEDKYAAGNAANASTGKSRPNRQSTAGVSKKPAGPDFGLSASHDVLFMLGKGGEGETWLCKVNHRVTKEGLYGTPGGRHTVYEAQLLARALLQMYCHDMLSKGHHKGFPCAPC